MQYYQSALPLLQARADHNAGDRRTEASALGHAGQIYRSPARAPHSMYAKSHMESWPELSWDRWRDTAETLHMWTQIVGKTRLALTPVANHWWNVPLYVTARGLSTSAMPLPESALLDIEFDFLSHQLTFRHSSGGTEKLALRAQSVAAFLTEYLAILNKMGVSVALDYLPVELKDPIRFTEDTLHKSYDPNAAEAFWRVLTRAHTLFQQFSTNFYGKISPVHFFWGSFDLAVTRFNGRKAPPRPGADRIQSEAYSHECISAGFWPGNGGYGRAAFYAYAAPVPAGLSDVKLTTKGGFNKDFGEFLLDYDDVRASANPEQTVLDFLNNTYAAAADLSGWDRASLDRTDGVAAAAAIAPPSR